MKKKLTSTFIALALALTCAGALVSCGGEESKSDEKINILCSVFPIYDWVSNIVGDSDTVSVTLLVSGGGDLHSYEPSAADMIKITNSDVVFYVGGTSDAWLSEALEKNSRDGRQDVSLIDFESITKRPPCDEFILGEDHDHDHDHSAVDEHIWLSIDNAIAASKIICNTMADVDSENSEKYEANLNDYSAALTELKDTLSVPEDTQPLIFADRFPFVYLFGDLNIPYYAAFSGCTAEVDATFDTIVRLATLADKLESKYIFVTESPAAALASTVIETTKSKSAEILVLDSMQSVTRIDIDSGTTYISVMKKNLEIIASAIKQ